MKIVNEDNEEVQRILKNYQLMNQLRGLSTAGSSLGILAFHSGVPNDIVPVEDDEYKNLNPRLTDEKYKSLKAKIKEAGKLWYPIVIEDVNRNGVFVILDGYHRFKAWKELKKILKKEEKDIPALVVEFESKAERIKFIMAVNVVRRQYTDYQAVVSKYEALQTLAGFDPESQIKLTELETELKIESVSIETDKKEGKTRNRVPGSVRWLADDIGIDRNTVNRILFVYRTPNDAYDIEGIKPVEKVRNELKNGVMSATGAVSEIKKGMKQQARRQQRIQYEANASKSGNYTKLTLYHGDFRDVMTAKIQDQSVNVIITDPLYDINLFTPQDMEDLAEQSARVLKDDGALVMVHEVANLPEIIQMMTKHLNFYWLLIDPKTEFMNEINGSINGETIKLHNSDRKDDVNLLHGYKPIYILMKKGKKTDLAKRIADIVYIQKSRAILYEDVLWNTKAPPKVKTHEFEQSHEMIKYLFNMFTKRDDVVLDMFAGGGTTLSVGRNHNLKEIIGIDKADKTIKNMEQILNVQIQSDECLKPDCELHHPLVKQNNNPVTSEGVTID